MASPSLADRNGCSVCWPDITHLACDTNNTCLIDFVVAKVTPTLVTDLGYKLFFMFATINILGMAVFSW
jgi:hypothetical protein